MSPDITPHAFVPNALRGAWEEAHFSWLFKLAKPRLRAMRPQISVASSSRQTAARADRWIALRPEPRMPESVSALPLER